MLKRLLAAWLAGNFALFCAVIGASPASAAPGDTACQRYDVLREADSRADGYKTFIYQPAIAYAYHHCQQRLAVDDEIMVEIPSGPKYRPRSTISPCKAIESTPVETQDPQIQRQQAECIADWFQVAAYSLNTSSECRRMADSIMRHTMPPDCFSTDDDVVRPTPASESASPGITDGVDRQSNTTAILIGGSVCLVIASVIALWWFRRRRAGGGRHRAD